MPTPEAPTPAPGAPVVAVPAPTNTAPTEDRQLNLFAWKPPKPRRSVQLNLFGEPESET